MRLAIIYIFLIVSFGLNAQVLTDFNATATVFFVRGTAPDYSIQALINNTTGQYSAIDVQVGDVLYMSEGSSCVRFQVLSVTVVGSSISATVRDIDGITSAFPMGIGMICRETANFSFPLHVDGISDDLLSCVRTHFTELVDQITVTGVPGTDTDSIYFDSAGVVSLATRGDTVILPIGGGTGVDTDEQNLSRSGDSILIERGTGVDLADLRDNTDTSGYNLDFRISNDTIFVRDGNSELFAVLPSGVVDTDTDSIFVDSAGVKTYLVQRGGTIYISGDEVNDADADATNEIQTLTKSNDTIYLSNGGFVIDADTDTNTDTDTIYFQFGSTIIRKVRNDTVNIPVAIDTTFASNDTIFFVSNGDTSIVILDVPGDNWGNQVVVSDATLTGNGTVSNPLSVVFPVDQVDDADADPTNEIQLLSKSNDTIYLRNGGGFVIDTDTDTNTDEQNLTLVADSLKIERGTGVDLSKYLDNTDTSGYNATLTISNDSVYITDGSGTLKAALPKDLVFDGDSSVTNELQDIDSVTFSGNILSVYIEGGASASVDLSSISVVDTDSQSLSIINDTLSISRGNSVSLLPYLDDTNTDEQNLTRSGDSLLIERGSGVDLADFRDNTDTSGYNLTFQKVGDSLFITDAAGTLSVYIPDSVGGFVLPTDSITFNNNESGPDQGELNWDASIGFPVFGGVGGISMKIGQDALWLCENQTGSLITKGTVVGVVGSLGNSGKFLIAPFTADGNTDNDYLLGIAAEDIPNGSDGYVMHQGKIRQIDLTAYPQGAILYASPTVAGELTTIEPANGFQKFPIAFVVDSSANGTLGVRVKTGEALRDLHDVDVSTAADGDLIYYDATAGYWKTKQDSVIDADADPTNEIQTLSWDAGTNGQDEITLSNTGGTITITDDWGSQVVTSDATLIGDGTSTSNLKIAQQGATINQVLKWSGATWAPDDDTDEQGLSLVQLNTNIYSIDIDNTSDDFVIQGDNGITLSAPIPGVDQLKISGPGQGNGIGIFANDLFVDSENLTEAGTLGSGDFFVIDDASVGSGSPHLTTRKISPANLNLSLMNNDAGFITSEVDGSTTNEVQSFNFAAIANGEQISLTLSDDKFELIEGTNITLSRNVDAITINATGDGTGTDDQQISEFAIVSNNLNLTLEGDATGQKTVDLSPYLDNTDSQGFTGSDNGTTFTFNLSGTTNDISLTEGTNVTMTRSGNNVTINATGDGNGVYDGSGTIPAGTISTIAGGDWELKSDATSPVTRLNLMEPESGLLDRSAINLYKDDAATSAISFISDPLSNYAEIYFDANEDFNINAHVGNLKFQNNTATHLQVNQDGTIDLPDYGGGTITGTPSYYLAVDAAGNVIEATPATGTDDQDLTGASLTGTTLQIGIENGASASVDLASLQDGTGTDDQTIDVFELSGTDLNLSLESDNQPTKTVSLASLSDVYTSSEGIKETSKDFKLGEDAASSTAFITSDRFLNFGSSTTNSLILNNETGATTGTFAPLTIKSLTSGTGAGSAIKFVAGTGTYNTGYIEWAEPDLNEQGFTFVGGYVRIGNFASLIPPSETILTTRDPDNEIAKVNVNQIGVPVSTYTAIQGGSISINFASDGRHIAEVDCSAVTSAFTANVIGEGTMTTDFAAIYNVRFHSVGVLDITVTLDAGDTWYNEKGDVITTLTLTANEDKIMTFYTKDGINFYTME